MNNQNDSAYNLKDFERLLDDTFGPGGTGYRDRIESNAIAFCKRQAAEDALNLESIINSNKLGENVTSVS